MEDQLAKELMQEILQKNVDGVKRCIDNGADVNYHDYSGLTYFRWTPLHYAVQESNKKVIELLLSAKANPSLTSKGGDTPLHYAAKYRNDEVCKLLLDAKADPNATNKAGDTPLHYAAKYRNDEVCKLLLDAKADPNATNKAGNTPLHDVCRIDTSNTENKFLTIELLLRAGGDANIRNKENEIPFHYLQNKVERAHAKKIDQSVSLCQKLMTEGSQSVDAIKVYMCGDPSAGKTTLKTSLTNKLSILEKFGIRGRKRGKQSDSESYDCTPGIDVAKQSVENESYIFWDCAGQLEYSLTHGMFLGVGHSVFIVVYDLQKFSESKKATIRYWLPFIKSVKSATEKPRVILVGTHYDAIRDKKSAELAARDLIAEAQVMFVGALDIDDTLILVDSREINSEGLAGLKDVMKKHRSEILSDEKVPQLCFKLLKKVIRPLRKQTTIPVIRWNSYKEMVYKLYPGLVGDMLQAATKYLHLMGEVYIAQFDEAEDLVIIDTNWFTKNIIGAAFAGKEFAEQFDILPNQLFYTMEKLKSFFTVMEDTTQLLNLLDDMDLVHQSDSGQYLLPGKLPDDTSDVTWSTKDACEVKGISIESVEDIDIFNPNVFPSVQKKILDVYRGSFSISRLAVAFAEGPIRLIIQQTEHRRSINIAAQCSDVNYRGVCYTTLQKINKMVSSEIAERSPGTNTRQTYISQDSLFSKPNLQGVKTYTKSQLVEAEEEQDGFVTSAGKSEEVTKILFEGYETMFLDIFGPNCRYEWLPAEIKEISVSSLDNKDDLFGEDYKAVGTLLGMEEHVVEQLAEDSRRQRQSPIDNIVKKWCITHKRKMTLAMFQQVLYFLGLVAKQDALKAIDGLVDSLMQQKPIVIADDSEIDFGISERLVQWRVVLKRLWRKLKAGLDPNMLTSRLTYLPDDTCAVIEGAKEGDIKARVENAETLLRFLLHREQADWPDDLLKALKETDQKPLAEVLEKEMEKVFSEGELRTETFQRDRTDELECDDLNLQVEEGATCAAWNT